MPSNVGFMKLAIGTSITILLNVVVSFFLANMITPKKDDKYNFFRIFIIIFIMYLLSKINDFTNSNRTIFIMAGYILAIFIVSKDKWYKKIGIFLLSFIPSFIANVPQNFIVCFKLGYSLSEFNNLLGTTEGFKYISELIYQKYASFALSGIINILYTFLLIVILLIRNRKKYKGFEIFLITFLITILSYTSGVLAYFYLNDILATIVMYIIVFSSIFIMLYSFNKLKFYQLYYENVAEIKYLKEKEVMQYEYYKELLNKEEQINKINHDIKNDLQVISSLKTSKDKEKIITKINDKLNNSNIKKYSKNNILNMLLNIKANEAKEKNIDIRIEIKKDLKDIEEIDIVNLFSNILDNAINAQGDSKGEIILNVEEKLGNLTIYCKNTINNKKQIHGTGYGLKIIKDIVTKYNGDIKIENDNKYYNLIIIIERAN